MISNWISLVEGGQGGGDNFLIEFIHKMTYDKKVLWCNSNFLNEPQRVE